MFASPVVVFGVELSGIGDLAAWIAVVFTALAGAAAIAVFATLQSRERRQALSDLHASLTSAETAQARNVIGALLYSRAEDDKPGRLASIEAYFALIWALQRARNVFRTYRIRWIPLEPTKGRLSELTRPGRKDAKLALTWNLDEIAENVVRFRDLFGREWAVEDADAWADIGTYVVASRFRNGNRGAGASQMPSPTSNAEA